MALKGQIGENAGKVWNALAQVGNQTVTQLAKEVDESKENVLLALGWLAREDKIDLNLEKRTYRVSLK